MRVSLQPAWVLHARPYRDTSLLLEIFTAEHGRESLVARGARSQRRRRGGNQAALLQPFVPLLVSWVGRGELHTLTACEAAAAGPQLRGERLFSGLYLNELLLRLLHRHDPHPRLFASYAGTLGRLAEAPALDAVLRRFELDLLDELGYGFALDSDGLSGEALQAQHCYRFDTEHGLVRTAASQAGALPGGDLLQIAAGDFSGDARSTARRLLRAALASHLGPEPLRSRALFRQSRRD